MPKTLTLSARQGQCQIRTIQFCPKLFHVSDYANAVSKTETERSLEKERVDKTEPRLDPHLTSRAADRGFSFIQTTSPSVTILQSQIRAIRCLNYSTAGEDKEIDSQ